MTSSFSPACAGYRLRPFSNATTCVSKNTKPGIEGRLSRGASGKTISAFLPATQHAALGRSWTTRRIHRSDALYTAAITYTCVSDVRSSKSPSGRVDRSLLWRFLQSGSQMRCLITLQSAVRVTHFSQEPYPVLTQVAIENQEPRGVRVKDKRMSPLTACRKCSPHCYQSFTAIFTPLARRAAS